MYEKNSLCGRHDLSPEARFWARVEKTDTCWLWLGSRNDEGYGSLQVDRMETKAHRYAYLLLVGPIPEGQVIDHTCLVKNCVNPNHLRPLTQKDNSKAYWRDQRGLCRNGLHDVSDPANHVIWKRGDIPSVRCKACVEASEKRKAQRRREKRASRSTSTF